MATPTDRKNQPYTPLANQPAVGDRGFGQTHQHMKTGPNATDDSRHAYDLVESEFGPSRTAAMQQLSRLGMDRQYEQGIQENFGQVHDQTLARIAQELQQQLGAVTDRTQQLYSGASSVIGDAYGRAQQATQGASDDVLSALAEQMQRLGLEEAGRDPNRDVSQLATDMSGRHAISGAGAVGNAEALGADMTSIAALRQGDAAQDWAQKRNDLAQQVMAEINQINHNYNQERDEVFGQIQAMERARGQALSATHRQVIEDRLERERQDRLDALAAEMSRRGMGVQEGYLGLAADRLGLDTQLGLGNLDIARGHLGVSQGQLGLQREQLEMQKQQLQTELEQAQDPLQRTLLEMQIRNIDSQIRERDTGTAMAGSGQADQDYRGARGLDGYLQQNFGTSNVAISLRNAFDTYAQSAADRAAFGSANYNAVLEQQIRSHENPTERAHLMNMFHIMQNQY
jgi:hypothetical protein